MHTHSHDYVARLLNNARYEAQQGPQGIYCRAPYIWVADERRPLRIGHRELRDEFGRLRSEDPAPSPQEALEFVEHLHSKRKTITLPGVSSRAPDMVFTPVEGGWAIR